MKIIKKLEKFISEELSDAECYAKTAIKMSDEDTQMAKMFSDMANQELGHAEQLHNKVVRLINSKKDDGEEIPEGMMAVYEFLHDREIEKLKEIKVLLDIFKNL